MSIVCLEQNFALTREREKGSEGRRCRNREKRRRVEGETEKKYERKKERRRKRRKENT